MRRRDLGCRVRLSPDIPGVACAQYVLRPRAVSFPSLQRPLRVTQSPQFPPGPHSPSHLGYAPRCVGCGCSGRASGVPKVHGARVPGGGPAALGQPRAVALGVDPARRGGQRPLPAGGRLPALGVVGERWHHVRIQPKVARRSLVPTTSVLCAQRLPGVRPSIPGPPLRGRSESHVQGQWQMVGGPNGRVRNSAEHG